MRAFFPATREVQKSGTSNSGEFGGSVMEFGFL